MIAGAECWDMSKSADEVEKESLSSPFVSAPPPVLTLLSLFVALSFPNSDRSNVRVGCWQRGGVDAWGRQV